MCGLTKLNKLYLITPAGKNTDVSTLCSSDKGIATAEFNNLQYFGIVGDKTYIQNTEIKYTTTIYDVTDVSGLANLSKVTKEAIQYMYLQNLQLTSIASLADYKNVTVLRAESNALTTFEGIQNMEKLTYLIAPNCYSNETSSYTLGINETEIQNTSTDALSYIYKDANGKNTALYCLNVESSTNLKWVSYLSTCTGLKMLYMNNSTSIKDVSTIATIIGNCGTNYELPSTYTTSIISNNSVKLDLTSQTITEAQFRTLKNNINLLYLCLDSTKIVTNNTTEFSDDDYTNLVNEVLSTCTNMIDLSMVNQTKLKNINFISNMPKMIALNLYNCSKISDLSKIEEATNSGNLKLGFLCLNNENIDLTTIQNTISCLGEAESGATWHSGSYGASTGIFIGNKNLLLQLSNCTEITSLKMSRQASADSYIPRLSASVDLTNCTKLKNIMSYCSRIVFKAPSSVISFIIGYAGNTKADLSNCINLEKLEIKSETNAQALIDTINSLPENLTTVKKIEITNCNSYDDWEFLSKFSNCKDLESFSFSQCHINNMPQYKDLTGLRYLTYVRSISVNYKESNINSFTLPPLENLVNLQTLTFTNAHCNDITNASTYTQVSKLVITGTNIKDTNALSNLQNLTSLKLENNKLTDISGLSSLVNLTSLDLSNNNLNDIKPLENLKKLEGLDLKYNALYDSSYDKNGKAYYTLTVLSDLNQKQDGSLKRLFLDGNSIDDFSMLDDSNLQWDQKTGW